MFKQLRLGWINLRFSFNFKVFIGKISFISFSHEILYLEISMSKSITDVEQGSRLRSLIWFLQISDEVWADNVDNELIGDIGMIDWAFWAIGLKIFWPGILVIICTSPLGSGVFGSKSFILSNLKCTFNWPKENILRVFLSLTTS